MAMLRFVWMTQSTLNFAFSRNNTVKRRICTENGTSGDELHQNIGTRNYRRRGDGADSVKHDRRRGQTLPRSGQRDTS